MVSMLDSLKSQRHLAQLGIMTLLAANAHRASDLRFKLEHGSEKWKQWPQRKPGHCALPIDTHPGPPALEKGCGVPGDVPCTNHQRGHTFPIHALKKNYAEK